MSEQIPAYAVGYLRDVVLGDDIIRYMREIDATLNPSAASSSCTAAISRQLKASGTAPS
jgi:hypothetical protein